MLVWLMEDCVAVGGNEVRLKVVLLDELVHLLAYELAEGVIQRY
ncbi:hypothetical protein GCM10028895_35710 [Pontibacter rugosus]